MVYITHIRLKDGAGVQHISHVKWTNPNTQAHGTSTRPGMVEFINGGGRANVQDGTRKVAVQVVNANPPYLRTVADGRETNNLLSLPHF